MGLTFQWWMGIGTGAALMFGALRLCGFAPRRDPSDQQKD
jgi:hypothetical protein